MLNGKLVEFNGASSTEVKHNTNYVLSNSEISCYSHLNAKYEILSDSAYKLDNRKNLPIMKLVIFDEYSNIVPIFPAEIIE